MDGRCASSSLHLLGSADEQAIDFGADPVSSVYQHKCDGCNNEVHQFRAYLELHIASIEYNEPRAVELFSSKISLATHLT
jgi:hypothetical protein